MKLGIYKVWVTTENGKQFTGQIEAESLAEVVQDIINKFGPKVTKTIVTPQSWRYLTAEQAKEYQYENAS